MKNISPYLKQIGMGFSFILILLISITNAACAGIIVDNNGFDNPDVPGCGPDAFSFLTAGLYGILTWGIIFFLIPRLIKKLKFLYLKK